MSYESIFKEKFDELIAEEMSQTNTAGTSVAMVDNGEMVFTRNYGARDFELGIPVNSDTLFCIASVTKSFICAGIMKLQEEDKLGVHDPINEYLPVEIGYNDDPITIHHLMSHQSGIPNLADGMWGRNLEESLGKTHAIPKYPFTSWEDGFRFLNGSQEYVERPGKRFHYNNFGYGILSKLITEVTEDSYKTYIQENLLDPLEMNRTGFYREIRDDDNLSVGYMDIPDSDKGQFIQVHYDDIRLTRSLDEAAGGLFSSVNELSHFMICLLQKGEFKGKQVLSRESIESMQQRHFNESYPNSSFAAFYGLKESGYGYGFVIDEDFFGHKLVQHSGSFIGASAWFAFFPEEQKGGIMLSNHHPSPRILTQAILLESEGVNTQEEWGLFKLRNFQEKLSGSYETYKGLSKVEITSSQGQLYMNTAGARSEQPLLPLDGNNFGMNYYFITEMGGKMPVQFYEEDDNVWLHIERNKWKKQ